MAGKTPTAIRSADLPTSIEPTCSPRPIARAPPSHAMENAWTALTADASPPRTTFRSARRAASPQTCRAELLLAAPSGAEADVDACPEIGHRCDAAGEFEIRGRAVHHGGPWRASSVDIGGLRGRSAAKKFGPSTPSRASRATGPFAGLRGRVCHPAGGLVQGVWDANTQLLGERQDALKVLSLAVYGACGARQNESSSSPAKRSRPQAQTDVTVDVGGVAGREIDNRQCKDCAHPDAQVGLGCGLRVEIHVGAGGGAPVQHFQRGQTLPTLTKCSSSSSASIGQMRSFNQRSSGRSSAAPRRVVIALWPCALTRPGRDNVIWQDPRC